MIIYPLTVAKNHQVGCRLTWFGIQDAARKRREASQTPGAWAGTIIHTVDDCVSVLVSQDKWDKTKKWLNWMNDIINDNKSFPHNELEKCRGFLIYVSRTYRPFIPYLRGVHQTIDSWRGYRDIDGWKLQTSEIAAIRDIDDSIEERSEPTKFVKPAKRLVNDIKCLIKLAKDEAPPKVVRRRKKTATALYGIGDASGKGFGHCIHMEGKSLARFGTWGSEVENKHSNFKEMQNLVMAIKAAFDEGMLDGAEMFIFTDNYVAECAYFNGGSNKSKELDMLVYELWELQMSGNFTLHVFHIAGTRMIECGIDGLSRGDKLEGVMKGEELLSFVPIHKSPLERNAQVFDWINSWWDEDRGSLKLLNPEEWFTEVMNVGNYVWDIPPVGGGAIVEQLCSHTHGRPENLHIIVIPRLCTSLWRKQLNKVCDLMITIQPRETFWTSDMHEPLMLGISFPIYSHHSKFSPWKLRGTRMVEELRTNVHRVQSDGGSVDWNCLRELLVKAREIPTMSASLARKLLQVKAG